MFLMTADKTATPAANAAAYAPAVNLSELVAAMLLLKMENGQQGEGLYKASPSAKFRSGRRRRGAGRYDQRAAARPLPAPGPEDVMPYFPTLHRRLRGGITASEPWRSIRSITRSASWPRSAITALPARPSMSAPAGTRSPTWPGVTTNSTGRPRLNDGVALGARPARRASGRSLGSRAPFRAGRVLVAAGNGTVDHVEAAVAAACQPLQRPLRHIPAQAQQRSKRVQSDCQGPVRPRQVAPGRAGRRTHRVALTISRLLRLGLPGRPRSGGNSGSIARFWPSVSSVLAAATPREARGWVSLGDLWQPA